ncbi:iron-sulfur cluster assembly accessory protein [Bradyrhizobium sp. UFLA05-153]
MMLQAGGSAGCDLCLAISPSGCSGLACCIGPPEQPRVLDAPLERGHVEPVIRPEGPLPDDGVTIDFVDIPKRIGLVLEDRKQVSRPHH